LSRLILAHPSKRLAVIVLLLRLAVIGLSFSWTRMLIDLLQELVARA